jgi:hypothetical protein
VKDGTIHVHASAALFSSVTVTVVITTSCSMDVSVSTTSAEHLSDLNDIEDQASHGNDEHSSAENLRLLPKSRVSFFDQEDRHDPNRDDGDHGSNQLGSVPPKGHSLGGIFSAEADCSYGNEISN